MILILSHDDDPHAQSVARYLAAADQPYTILDLSEFPQSARLTLEPGAVTGRRVLHYRDEVIDLTQISAVWWRRPQPYGMSEALTDPVMDNFAIHEVDEAIQGLWLTLDASWINPPARDQDASRKIWQLDVAQRCGLTVPRTLVTNNPDDARAFALSEGIEKTIYKPFQGSEDAWRETRILKPQELDQIDAVQYAPVIFQEYIEADADLRVTVVGDKIFPAAITSHKNDYAVDFRMNMDVTITPTTLQPETEAALRRLMTEMGLFYGAIDFRRRPNGEDVFLEINPAGQWLFVEDQTEQQISAEIAHWLTHAAEVRQQSRQERVSQAA